MHRIESACVRWFISVDKKIFACRLPRCAPDIEYARARGRQQGVADVGVGQSVATQQATQADHRTACAKDKH